MRLLSRYNDEKHSRGSRMVITVVDFRKNMAYYLEHLEEEIYLSRHKKVVGVVSPPRNSKAEEMAACLHELSMQIGHLNELLQSIKQ